MISIICFDVYIYMYMYIFVYIYICMYVKSELKIWTEKIYYKNYESVYMWLTIKRGKRNSKIYRSSECRNQAMEKWIWVEVRT